ncbi:hypothetical protein ACLKA7_005513 [Drosophila subpalustris]
MVGVSCVYFRRRDQLIAIATEFGLDTEGTVADLRTRVAELVSIRTHAEQVNQRSVELEQQYREASGWEHSDSKSRSRSVSPVPRDRVVPQVIVTAPGSQPPSSRLLRGNRNHSPATQSTSRTDTPYRTIAEKGASWATFKQDFLDFFLPPRYFQRLEDQIRARQQRPGEAFKTYIVELRMFMKRASYSGVQELDRAYENMLPEYQLYIRRHEAHSLAQLTQLATDFEFVRDRERQSSGPAQLGLALAHDRDEPDVVTRHRNPFRDTQPSTQLSGGEPPVSRMIRCGEIGHQARDCRNRQLYYCWRCGKRGIKTTECCGLASGNKPRPYLPQDQARIVAQVQIEGQVRQATIDTGTTRSFVSEAAASQLGSRQLRDVRAKVSMADGSRATVCKALIATVQLGKKCACIPFLVLSTDVDDVILGIDFLCAIRASLHCGPVQLQLTPMCLPTLTGFVIPSAPPRRARILFPHAPHGRRPKRDRSDASVHGGAIAIPPEPDPHVNEADDDDPSETKPRQEEEPELEPWVRDFLEQELAQFETLTGVTHIAEHAITMKDDRPIKQRYYPKNPAMQRIIDQQGDELLKNNCLEPPKSNHSAPIVLVGKKTGDVRMCIDYRQLNANSIPDAYPLPRIHHILERLRNAKYISTLDLKSGYWQIPMAHGSREYTAFTVPGRGLFHWKVMLVGLLSALATFQRAWTATSALTWSRSLSRTLGTSSVLQPPTTCRELRRCLGIASWYRRFVPNFADIVQPLSLMLKKGQKWDWKPEQQAAFEELRARLSEAPVLACPDISEKFVLQTDASECGLGLF